MACFYSYMHMICKHTPNMLCPSEHAVATVHQLYITIEAPFILWPVWHPTASF